MWKTPNFNIFGKFHNIINSGFLNKKNFFIILLLVLIILSSFCFFSYRELSNSHSVSEKEYLDYLFVEILVKFIPEADPSDIARLHRQNHAQPVNTLPEIGVYLIKVPAASAADTLASYNNHPLVKFAEFNLPVQALDFPQDPPNDPHFELQWGTKRIKAPEAWAVTTSSPDVRIAILDTGIDLDHPDLSAKIVASKNFSDSSTANDISGHGTHVAGIAAAITNNAIGVAGVGCHASLLNGKVLGDDGGGVGFSIAQGILWATNGPDGDPNTDDGAHVINLSLGTLVPSPTVEEAINYAWEHGVVITAAAGNHGSTSAGYPARYPNVIAVAGSRTYPGDPLVPSSAHGDWVDVAAPGEAIWSTWNDGSYNNGAGTSMASPFVAGLAALLFTSPNISDLNGNGFINDEIKYAIEASCKDTGVDVKYGRVNAYDAVTTGIPSLGFVSGTVVDDSTGDPVYPTYGCSVKAGTREAFTHPDGSYTIYGVPAGDYELTVSALGWEEASSSITVTPGGTTIANFRLITSPSGAISGFVRDIYFSPIEGATVTDGTRQTTSAADGSYTLTNVPAGNYTVTASAPGYIPTSSGVIVNSNETTTQNFILPVDSGECNPGDTEERSCGSGECAGTQTRTCQTDHYWGSWGDCSSEGNSCGVCPDDGCKGINWYDYPNNGVCVSGVCNTGTGSGEPCEPTISYNDPRCSDSMPPDIPAMNSEPEYTSGTSNTVSCSEVTDSGVGGVEYQFCKNTSNTTSSCDSSAWSSSNSATFSDLTSGQIYYYFARARDSLENTSDWSASVFSTQDAEGPTQPGLLSTDSPPTDTTPTWTWTPSVDSGVGLADVPYTVQWSTDSTFQTGVNSTTTDTNSFTHITPLNNGTWYFRVRAKDKFGYTSAWSETGSVVISSPAVVSTDKALGILGTQATLNGNLESDYSAEVWFVWDTVSHSDY
ncbi:MAG: hypothetical protein DRP74_08285, partial [Candidatus Omnitrophota bacterium]